MPAPAPDRLARWFALSLLGALTLCGCRREAPPVIEDRKLVICATEFPLADIVREVGADHVQVDWLIDLGDPILGFTLNAEDRGKLRQSDLVVCDSTQRTEPWAAAEVARLRGAGSVISCNTLPGAQNVSANGILYLDPQIARAFAESVVDTLITHRPRYAEEFRQNAKAFVSRLDAIVAKYPKSSFGPSKPVMLSSLFTPFMERFGVRPIEVDADPLWITPEAITAIRGKAAAEGSQTLLIPFDTPPGTRSDLARRTGLTVLAIDPLGFRNFEQHGSYLDLLRFNLEELRQATLPNLAQ